MSVREAMLWFGMHPLELRRDIAMLGVLYKCAHGIAHPDLQILFPRDVSCRAMPGTRLLEHRHAKQLLYRHHGEQRAEFHRSIFGLVKIWNILSSEIVERKCVSRFQNALTDLARKVCEDGVDGWSRILAPPNISPVLLRYLR